MFNTYQDILTTKEAQQLLRVSKKTIYRLISENKIQARKIGKNYRIPKESICQFMGKVGEWE